MNTVEIKKTNWSGETVKLHHSDTSGTTPDFEIEIDPTDDPDIFKGYVFIPEGEEEEEEFDCDIIRDGNDYIAFADGITREADNPVIAVAQLAYNLL